MGDIYLGLTKTTKQEELSCSTCTTATTWHGLQSYGGVTLINDRYCRGRCVRDANPSEEVDLKNEDNFKMKATSFRRLYPVQAYTTLIVLVSVCLTKKLKRLP